MSGAVRPIISAPVHRDIVVEARNIERCTKYRAFQRCKSALFSATELRLLGHPHIPAAHSTLLL